MDTPHYIRFPYPKLYRDLDKVIKHMIVCDYPFRADNTGFLLPYSHAELIEDEMRDILNINISETKEFVNVARWEEY